jgi:hypothetical protein
VLTVAPAALARRPPVGSLFGLSLAGSGLRLGGSIIAARRDALLRIRGDRQGDQDRNKAGISHSSTRVVRLASLNDKYILHQIRVQRCTVAPLHPIWA